MCYNEALMVSVLGHVYQLRACDGAVLVAASTAFIGMNNCLLCG